MSNKYLDIIRDNKYLIFIDECNIDNDIINIIDHNINKCVINNNKIGEIINRYIYKEKLVKLQEENNIIINKIDKFYKNLLITEQYNKLMSNIEIIKNYKNIRKTKKKREEYKISIEFINKISNQKGIDLCKSIEIINNNGVPINSQKIQFDNNKNTTYIIYNEYIEQLLKNMENIKKEEEFINNTIKESKRRYNEHKEINNEKNQIGKYYKRWTLLTKEQQIERMDSYTKYYCINNDIKDIQKMSKYIKENFEMNNIKNSDIKWDTKHGIIINVNIIYDKDNNEYRLKEKVTKILNRSKGKGQRIKEEDLNDILLTNILYNNNLDKIYDNVKLILKLDNIKATEKKYIKNKYEEVKNTINSFKE